MKRSHGLGMLLVLGAGLALGSCESVGPEEVGTYQMPTIYGAYDVQEFYQTTDPTAVQLFASDVGVFSRSDGSFTSSADGGYDIAMHPTLDEYKVSSTGYHLCDSEPFKNQPTPAYCSGFMVGPDLIATAGHCVSKGKSCLNTAFVFGFHMADAVTPVLHVGDDDVYTCKSIVGRVETTTNDWAVVRVDRPIVGHEALPLRRSGAVQSDSRVAGLSVIGHPAGIPAKYADNATVKEAGNPYYFMANVDVYAGNSGSAVVSLDATGALLYVEGILVRGNPDWDIVRDASGAYCMVSNMCPDSGCTGTDGDKWEEITRSTVFAPYVPEPIVCGDGSCVAGETCDTCPDDCGDCPFCGNGTCDADETCESCSADCGDCPVCGIPGSTCTANSDCCSGTCHPKKHVCR
jgi:V8-like Glu-specific endopeptidase